MVQPDAMNSIDLNAGTKNRTVEPQRALSRSRKSEKKRRAIMRAATDIINAKSFALATMTEIAASLELRDATLYYYFPSKQALAYACHRRSLETYERLLRQADDGESNGAAKLEHFLRGMLKDAEVHGAQLYLGDYTYLEPEQRDIVAAWTVRLTKHLERFLTVGIADGSVRPCETSLVVQLLLGMLIWLAKWAPSTAEITADRLINAIGVVSLEGLRAEASV